MKRWMTRLLFAVGVLVSTATGTLLARGFWRNDEFRVTRSVEVGRPRESWQASLNTDRIQLKLGLTWTRSQFNVARPGMRRVVDWDAEHRSSDVPRLFTPDPVQVRLRDRGFRYWTARGANDRQYAVEAPTWALFPLPAAMTGLIGVRLWRARRRRLRQAAALCPTCAYDLRGAPHERCPECGELVVAPARG